MTDRDTLRIAAYVVRAVLSFPGYVWRYLRGESDKQMKFRPEDVDMPTGKVGDGE